MGVKAPILRAHNFDPTVPIADVLWDTARSVELRLVGCEALMVHLKQMQSSWPDMFISASACLLALLEVWTLELSAP